MEHVYLQKRFADRYKVIKLTNRMEPEVGTHINDAELQELLVEAKRTGKLTIHIT